MHLNLNIEHQYNILRIGTSKSSLQKVLIKVILNITCKV